MNASSPRIEVIARIGRPPGAIVVHGEATPPAAWLKLVPGGRFDEALSAAWRKPVYCTEEFVAESLRRDARPYTGFFLRTLTA